MTNQAVFVYTADENGEYTTLVREMICSSGIEETNRSPRGTFTVGDDYKRFAFLCGSTAMPSIGARYAAGYISIPCRIQSGMIDI